MSLANLVLEIVDRNVVCWPLDSGDAESGPGSGSTSCVDLGKYLNHFGVSLVK